MGAEGRGQQKLAQIFREHPDGCGVGPFLEPVAEFGLQRGGEQASVAVQRGGADFASAGAVVADEEAGQQFLRLFFVAGTEGETQEAFLLTPEHGEDAVRGSLRGGLVPGEIVSVFGGVGIVLLAGGDLALHEPVASEDVAEASAGRLILGEAFREDVAGSGKGRVGVGHAFFGVHIGGGQRCGKRAILPDEQIGQRFEAAFAGH